MGIAQKSGGHLRYRMIKTPPEIGDHTRTFLKRVTAWICEITEYPGFRDWQHTRMQRVLTHHLDAEDTSLPDFHFDAGTLKKHQFVTSYIELIQAANFLRDTEFYFRRYPFGDLPITESDHIGYICDMLFSRIYQF